MEQAHALIHRAFADAVEVMGFPGVVPAGPLGNVGRYSRQPAAIALPARTGIIGAAHRRCQTSRWQSRSPLPRLQPLELEPHLYPPISLSHAPHDTAGPLRRCYRGVTTGTRNRAPSPDRTRPGQRPDPTGLADPWGLVMCGRAVDTPAHVRYTESRRMMNRSAGFKPAGEPRPRTTARVAPTRDRYFRKRKALRWAS